MIDGAEMRFFVPRMGRMVSYSFRWERCDLNIGEERAVASASLDDPADRQLLEDEWSFPVAAVKEIQLVRRKRAIIWGEQAYYVNFILKGDGHDWMLMGFREFRLTEAQFSRLEGFLKATPSLWERTKYKK